MKRKALLLLVLTLLALMAACAPAQAQDEVSLPPVVDAQPETDGSAPVQIGMPVPPADGEPASNVPEMIAIELTAHTDEAFGYTFDYPSAWMLDGIVLGSRAPGGYQITSWQHEPGMISETLPDGTVINIYVQLWDPKGDLPAFIEQQSRVWDVPEREVIFDEAVTLAGGKPAREFLVKTEGQGSYTLFTTLGDNYLVVSGTGDLEAVRQVAWSLR